MIDTDIASYIMRDDGRAGLLDRLEALRPSEACISAMTRAELLFGLKRVPENRRLKVGMTKFLESVRVLAWEAETAEFYADIRFQLSRIGTPIGSMDMLIAAHAMAVDAVLVTNNTRHFSRIKMPLIMVNWLE